MPWGREERQVEDSRLVFMDSPARGPRCSESLVVSQHPPRSVLKPGLGVHIQTDMTVTFRLTDTGGSLMGTPHQASCHLSALDTLRAGDWLGAFLVFESGSHCAAQPCLELAILLPRVHCPRHC